MVKMNGDRPVISNEEESFVVLERYSADDSSQRESLICSLTSQTMSHQNGIGDPASSSILSVNNSEIPLNMTYEEIQVRLQDLIKENENLKVAVQQHNLASKQQLQTLKMWQDEMLKVHQTHKAEFEETKAYIRKLTLENKELKQTLSEKPKIDSEAEELNSKIKTALMAENEDLKRKVQSLSDLLAAAQQREIKLSQRSSKEAELSSLVSSLSKQLENAERARRQLGIDNERLMAQQTRMHQQPLPPSVAVLGDEIDNKTIQPMEQIKRYTEWLQHMVKFEEEFARFGTSLESFVDVNTGGDAVLEVKELRKLLLQEQKLSLSRKETVGEIRQYFQRLLSDYQVLHQDWEWLKQEHQAKESVSSANETEHKKVAEQLDRLTAQLMEKTEEVSRNQELIKKLKEDLAKLQTDKEEIEVLTAQASIYKADFEAERKSREELVSEKNRIEEEHRLLITRNKQLITQLEAMHENTAGSANRQQPPTRSSSSSSSQDASRQGSAERAIAKFICPNPECQREFATIQPLEQHVISCLKLDD